jgi:DNA invertase Pin-like site-specific DNA recombinase
MDAPQHRMYGTGGHIVTSSLQEGLEMQAAVGYLRVSTQEQRRSGLGLAAQRREIDAFALREKFAIKSWHQDVQTGAGSDALLLRPGLATALKEAKSTKGTLIVSRLDRLSRNVHFIAGLMEHKVHFAVAALGKDCDHFVLHIYASLAEQERKLISDRVKSAAVLQKLRGQKFGWALRPKAWHRKICALSRAAAQRAATERAEVYRVHIEWALRQAGTMGRPISFSAAAKKLNERSIATPFGGRWRGHQMQRMAARIGIYHPLAYLKRHEVRATVHAIWARHPEFTVKQTIAAAGGERPPCVNLVRDLLRVYRREAAERSPVFQKIHWRIDSYTPARIHVGAIWKRHPEYSAPRVLKELGPKYGVSLVWVRQALHDFWRTSAKHNPEQRRIGRRCYGHFHPLLR